MNTMAAAAPAPLAPSQLKAQLWADPRCAVYGVLLGSSVPDIALRLAQADVVQWCCLLPGALTAAQQASAPYLVQLKPDAAFTDWLLFDAAPTLGPWGVVVLSPARRLALRAHLREAMQARLSDGAEIELRWMDPEVLLTLLPLLDAAALQGFMGPLHRVVVPGVQAWTVIEANSGPALAAARPALQVQHVPVAQAA